MKHAPATIAEFGRRAGFIPPALHTATALAMVCSGGLDHYDRPVGIPGAGRYVGLWAIDTDRWPEWPAEALMDPHVAARAAYELTRRHDGFGWSPAWARGAERGYLSTAAVASTMAPFTEPAWSPIAGELYRSHFANLAELAARRVDEGAAWPTDT